MSVGPMGTVGSAAGSQLAQSQGSDVTRTQQDTASQARQTRMDDKAQAAAGVGQTEQDEQANDRDADGRRPWEVPAPPTPEPTAESDGGSDEASHAGKDPTGVMGSQLDLQG